MKIIRKIVSKNIPSLEPLEETIGNVRHKEDFFLSIKGEIIRDKKDRSLVKYYLDGRFYYVKIWWASGMIRFVKDALRGGTGAIREARGLLLLNECEIKTPPLIAYGQIMQTKLRGFSYIVTEEIPTAETLADYLLRKPNHAIMQSLGRTLFRMHSRNVVHGDLHPENILVSGNALDGIYFVDFMDVRQKKLKRSTLADVINFYFYTDRFNWQQKEVMLEKLLSSYCERAPGGKGDMESLKIIISNGIRKRKRENAFKKMFLG